MKGEPKNRSGHKLVHHKSQAAEKGQYRGELEQIAEGCEARLQAPKPMGMEKGTEAEIGDGQRRGGGTVEFQRAVPAEKERVAGDETMAAIGERNEGEPDAQQPHLEGAAGRRISEVFGVVQRGALLFVRPKRHGFISQLVAWFQAAWVTTRCPV